MNFGAIVYIYGSSRLSIKIEKCENEKNMQNIQIRDI